MKLIETEWHKFKAAAIPEQGTEAQFRQMRRAFYAGAWAFYCLLMNGVEPGPEASPKDLELMEQLYNEMHEFMERMQKGWA